MGLNMFRTIFSHTRCVVFHLGHRRSMETKQLCRPSRASGGSRTHIKAENTIRRFFARFKRLGLGVVEKGSCRGCFALVYDTMRQFLKAEILVYPWRASLLPSSALSASVLAVIHIGLRRPYRFHPRS